MEIQADIKLKLFRTLIAM